MNILLVNLGERATAWRDTFKRRDHTVKQTSLDRMVKVVMGGFEPDVILGPGDTGIGHTIQALGWTVPLILFGDVTEEEAKLTERRYQPASEVGMEAVLEGIREIDERTPAIIDTLIGESLVMQRLKRRIERIAEVPSRTVLIEGRTGTGKNLVARILHQLSPEKMHRLVEVNCAALPGQLLESEMFGHVQGAFTGAHKDKKGLFEEAGKGTIFLDEIDSMPLELQAKLLRVLDANQLRRVGSVKERPVQCRVICASGRPLRDLVDEGTFRMDLYYRISVLTIRVPPLEERGLDVLLLANRFFARYQKTYDREDLQGFAPSAEECLIDHRWQGGVRELMHAVERACIFADGPLIEAEDLDVTDMPLENQDRLTLPLGLTLQDVELRYLRLMLAHRNGDSYAAVSETLGISKKTLWEKRKRYNLDEAD